MFPLIALLATFLVGAPVGAATPASIDTAVRTGHRATRDAALVIGNEGYLALPQANYATQDAHAFREWLLRTRGVSKYRVSYLENTGRERIMAELKRYQWRIRKHGTMWIYFAGHGTVSAGSDERVLLGVGADASDLMADSVTLSEMLEPFIKRKRADRIVVVLDAGFGNTGREGLELIPGHQVVVPEGFEGLDSRVIVWAASRDDRPAQSYEAARHGLFTWLALGALRGWADGELGGEPDGQVSFAEAQAFTTDAAQHLGRVVHPTEDRERDHLDWVIDHGAHLEPPMDPEQLTLLGKEDLEQRIARAESRLQSEASAFWQDTVALAQEGGPDARQALEAYIGEFSDVTLQIEWAVHIPEIIEARRALARYDDTLPEDLMSSVQLEPCDDLVALEATSRVGELRPGQIACLDARIHTDRLQTTRNRISRVLIVNAQTAGDKDQWEQLVRRHLEEIDRSDPNLCMSYAVYLYRSHDLDSGEEAIRWADYALENKQVWQPPDYQKNVYSLLRLRAEAAQAMWADAEQRYRDEPNAENEHQSQDYRGWTMDYSREWLDYARASYMPTERALQMCSSAAGTADFCRARPD